jgi:hypothetical protein
MRRSRRRFLTLLAAGSAAAVTAPVADLAGAAPKKRTTTKQVARPGQADGGPPLAIAEEIRKQKASVEQTLKVVREYRLPPGSEPAFGFAPLRPRKRGGTP